MALHEYQKQMYKKIGVILALVLLPVLGFFAGIQYQKQTATVSSPNGGAQFGTNGPRMLRADRTIGTVKAVSDTSLTITDRLSNDDKTYTLTVSTTFRDGSSEAKASDIKAGDTVALTLDSSDKTKVTAVTRNPAALFRGTEDAGPTGTDGAVLQ